MLDALAAATQVLLYAGVLCASGAVFAAASLRPSEPTASTLVRAARFGAITTILATALGLVVLILRLGADVDASIIAAVLASNVGAAAALRVSGALLLLLLPAGDESFAQGMQVSAAVLIVISFACSGHAATEGLAVGVVAALHVAIAAWWIGSLIAMARSADDAVLLVRRFSTLAVLLIGGLVVAGGVLIVVLVTFSPFEFTAYVRNLLIKVVIALSVFAFAAYNKFVLTDQALAGNRLAMSSLRRIICIEIALIAAVLVATAVLTTFSSPYQ